MADGTLIKDMALTTELNDDDDLIVEDSTPTTKRVKYSDLKEATVSNVRGSIGDAFDETATYASGDYCIYENTLYQFTADHAAGEWLGTDVEATTVAAELSELNGNREWKMIEGTQCRIRYNDDFVICNFWQSISTDEAITVSDYNLITFPDSVIPNNDIIAYLQGIVLTQAWQPSSISFFCGINTNGIGIRTNGAVSSGVITLHFCAPRFMFDITE
ncbi:MAG: hypothetical protein LUE23_04500 [Lachnospiraceae bacterium]|nr:hypothetical protein [Lachnospiraceae bacterium]